MLTGLSWLALEVKDLDAAREFYADLLELPVRTDRETGAAASNSNPELEPDPKPKLEPNSKSNAELESELAVAAGDTSLILRRPESVPRGGLHTHYAFSIPAAEYDDWWTRLTDAGYELEEAQFGSARSLYLYDPDGNCVELGQQDVAGPGIDGIFEVVLEVESLDRARSFYTALGFETADTGENRTRVRLDGPVALELWEPHLGIANARGGVHVDLGFETETPLAELEAVADRVRQVDRKMDDEVVVRDPDGHVVTFVSP